MAALTAEEREMLRRTVAAGGRCYYSREDYANEQLARFEQVAESLHTMGFVDATRYDLQGTLHLIRVDVTPLGNLALKAKAAETQA
jgi:hypothetical protein